MADSFISDDPNQPFQSTPIHSADAEANPLYGSDPSLGSDPNSIFGAEFGHASHAQVGEGSDPKPVPGSDPLLGSGDFIAANLEGGSNTTPVGKGSEAKRAKRAKRPRKGAEEAEGTPDWLPAGWTVTIKTRTTGATAGTVDRYYVDPTTGQRFRSKVEVKRFLETGSKNKSPSGANATPSETTGKDREKSGTKKAGTKKKKEAGWSFDFENPPEETTWSLVDGTWKPSIGGEQVPEATVQEWAATFELVCKME